MEDQKDSHGTPLMPSTATGIIEGLFLVKPVWKRSDLAKEVERIHFERGGVRGSQETARVVKRSLSSLKDDGVIENFAYSMWRRLLVNAPTPQNQTQNVTSALDMLDESSIEIENEIGSGSESVYVYFSQSQRELAGYKKSKKWPCKIGRTKGRVSDRIYDQGIKTSMSEEPIVGLIIKTEESTALESAIHGALTVGGDWMDCPGREWFMTSPEIVEKLYNAIMAVVLTTGDNTNASND